MISELTFADKDGILHVVPMAHMNTGPNTQVVAIGAKMEDFPNQEFASIPGVEALPIGKLSDWTGLSGIIFRNSLIKFGWEFALYPDPELVQLTDNRILN